MPSKYEKLISLAESYASDHRDDTRQHQVVAVAVKSGTPIALGINRRRYVKGFSVFESWLHAEMDLINKLGERVQGCDILVYRFNNTLGEFAREPNISKPCKFCQHLLKKSGISKVTYLDKTGEICTMRRRDLIELDEEPDQSTKRIVGHENHCNLYG